MLEPPARQTAREGTAERSDRPKVALDRDPPGQTFHMIAGIVMVWGVFLMLATVLAGVLGLGIVNSITRLVEWGVLESTRQTVSLAASGIVVLGLLAGWLWRRNLSLHGLRASPVGWALRFALTWSVIAVGLLTLMIVVAEPVATAIWQRRALLQLLLGVIPAIPVAWAIARHVAERLIFSNYGPISGDARLLPRSLLKKLKSQGLLPREPWWGFVSNPRKASSNSPMPSPGEPVEISLAGWVVGPDFFAELAFFKEVRPDSDDAIQSRSNWHVSGKRTVFNGPVEVRSRDLECGWDAGSGTEMIKLLGKRGYLLAIPISLRRKLLSVPEPTTEHVDILRESRDVDRPRLVVAIMSNADSLVAVRAERMSKRDAANEAEDYWHTTVIRAAATRSQDDLRTRATAIGNSEDEDPWSDWDEFRVTNGRSTP